MKHIVELDAVRGIAALVVLIFHLDNHLLPQGWLAVDLFLLLSGFLITSIILKQGRSHHFLRSFYARRALRIWPIYYLALVIAFLLTGMRHHPVLSSLPYYLTFTQNIPYYWSNAVPAFPVHFVHTWSLAVEEQYYLIWPLLVLLAGRKGLVPISCTLIVVCAIARASGSHWTLLVTRCDGLALGGILAVLFDRPQWIAIHRRSVARAFCLLGALAFALACVLWPLAAPPSPVRGSVWMLAVNLAFFSGLGLVVVYAGYSWLRPLRNGFLCGLGRVSYGLYLYHPIVFVIVDRASSVTGASTSLPLSVLKVGVSVVLASLSWRFVERPILGLKDRFPYGPPRVAPEPAGVESDRSIATGTWVTTPV